MSVINKIWYSQHPLVWPLIPFSYLYQILFHLHKLIYRLGLKKIFCSPVPLIAVGNLTVGGTGKTPFTISLAKLLQEAGYKPGIVSRGYKANAKVFPQTVSEQSDPKMVGDEPYLIRMKTECPVVIAPKRAQAVSELIKQFNCNVIISDDGLQHHALAKDIEIVLVDGQRKFGNSYCLPAGPLREPVSKLSSVDFVISHNTDTKQNESMCLVPGPLYNLRAPNRILTIEELKNKRVFAVAGIANNERFFNSLRQVGLNITEKPFPDHHDFEEKDFAFSGGEDIIVMTEKDAVKCRKFAKENYWVMPVTCQLSPGLKEKLLKRVKACRLGWQALP